MHALVLRGKKVKVSISPLPSLQPAMMVKTAIQTLLRSMKFNCENITVSSANAYHCNQFNRMSTLRANVTAYHAEERVEQLYSYLRSKRVTLFGNSAEVIPLEDTTPTTTPTPTPKKPMIYVYTTFGILGILVFVVVVFFVVVVVVIKKCRKK